MVPKSPHGQESPGRHLSCFAVFLCCIKNSTANCKLQGGQINQCTCPDERERDGLRGVDRDDAMCQVYFWTTTTLSLLASSAFLRGFPSSPLNRAILSAKIYDTVVGSILAKSYRKFSFSLGISQLGSAYFRRDLSRNELRTEESHLLSPIREAFPVPQYLMAEINRLPTCA